MYSFRNDYSEGAHPRILQALLESNLDQEEGYGEDRFSLEAADRLKALLERRDVDIHLFPGGTQVNLTALSAFLRPHEAAVAPATGHIQVHETGAIEATGHKVLAAPCPDGKLTPERIQPVLDFHTDEHMVKPRLVYISDSTEIGTIYTRAELAALSRYCREHDLYLYLDGARLGSALCAAGNDLALADLARLVDAFYIGGTKNGALLGEALVIGRTALKEDFRFHIKQKGAMLAKGRLLGIQFLELFRDGLYFDLARHANAMAERLRKGIAARGHAFLTDSPTNQVFPILPTAVVERLESRYGFYRWAPAGAGAWSVRLVTSWATPEAAVDAFLADLPEAGR